MPEDISKMKSIRAAYKGHCTQDFKKAEKHMASETSDWAELEALADRLTRTKVFELPWTQTHEGSMLLKGSMHEM